MSFTSLLVQAFSLLLLVFFALPSTEAKNAKTIPQGACINPVKDLSYPTCALNGDRYDIERNRLLKHIDRDQGKWDKKHPRWQILEAIQGFDRYTNIVGHEIDRFQDLYKHVSKKHKQVSQKADFHKTTTHISARSSNPPSDITKTSQKPTHSSISMPNSAARWRLSL